MRPSDEATISCGSGPDCALPRTFSDAGSTTDLGKSPFDRTSSLPEPAGGCVIPANATTAVAAIARADKRISVLRVIRTSPQQNYNARAFTRQSNLLTVGE